jgi:hypothetical protein
VLLDEASRAVDIMGVGARQRTGSGRIQPAGWFFRDISTGRLRSPPGSNTESASRSVPSRNPLAGWAIPGTCSPDGR